MIERFAPCPDSPNCVSSYADDEVHHVDPLPLPVGTESSAPALVGAASLVAVRRALASMPRTKIVTEDGDYVHATCTSLVFRFVDDLELRLDRQQEVIHVRSASRVGYGDLGVNRRRVERLRSLLESEGKGS